MYDSRQRFIEDFMHKSSRIIIDYLKENQIYLLVIGNNKGWKQHSKLSKQLNQTFIQIPYATFIEKLIYKAKLEGIKVCTTEKSYTSGTSFLDNESPTSQYYNISRREPRDLFVSNQGKTINADINAAFQIIKKVYPQIIYSQYINIAPIKITPNQKLNVS